uniref:Filamin n=1 Tax=Glossina austeni TaxID=7395 RepID=A0A1A9UTH3_GLOAU
MFKSSQEIRLNTSEAAAAGRYTNNSSREDFCIFGKYQKTPDADDKYCTSAHQVFVAPELTDTSRVQLLHFPNGAVRINSEITFIIKRNGVKGNFEVKLESPSGRIIYVPLKINDPERFEVKFLITEAGLYKVHIKCNSVLLPKSPYILVSITGTEMDTEFNRKPQLPVFRSDASKVVQYGLSTHLRIGLNKKNEFTVDGSRAGNNILFVGICGPKGQCDEVVIKHEGKNIYKVTYQIQDPGQYILAAKWGDEHISGSPFTLSAM